MTLQEVISEHIENIQTPATEGIVISWGMGG